jgi:hypothetical protein
MAHAKLGRGVVRAVDPDGDASEDDSHREAHLARDLVAGPSTLSR